MCARGGHTRTGLYLFWGRYPAPLHRLMSGRAGRWSHHRWESLRCSFRSLRCPFPRGYHVLRTPEVARMRLEEARVHAACWTREARRRSRSFVTRSVKCGASWARCRNDSFRSMSRGREGDQLPRPPGELAGSHEFPEGARGGRGCSAASGPGWGVRSSWPSHSRSLISMRRATASLCSVGPGWMWRGWVFTSAEPNGGGLLGGVNRRCARVAADSNSTGWVIMMGRFGWVYPWPGPHPPRSIKRC